MKTLEFVINSPVLRNRFFLGMCFIVALLCTLPSTVYARCQLLAPVGQQPVTIDGQLGTNEWNDAGSISSFQNGCLAGEVPVEVRAKRDNDNLYMAFKVTDSTNQFNPSDYGERVIIQLSPINLNGTTLGNGLSYKINVGHKWTQLTLDADKHFQKSSGSLFCPAGTPAGGTSGATVPSWQDQAWSADMDVKLGNFSSSGYYVLEFKIPKTALGITGAIPNDLAMSFIVINNAPPPSDKAFASWFPHGLEVDQVALTGQIISPDDPTGSCNTWVQTKEWSLASIAPSGDVYIAQTPESWWSQDIDTMQCPNYTTSGDQYNYYSSKPCRLKVRYWLRNTNVYDEKRDVLVLASAHGAGALQWQKIEFSEQVTIGMPQSGQLERRMDFVSVTQAGTDDAYLPPPGINAYGHPCVRVYILPTIDDPAFSKQNLRTKQDFTDADLNALSGAYKLDMGKHWAQQNISRAAHPDCPNGNCQTASLGGGYFADAGSPMLASTGLSLQFLGDSLLPTAYAQPLTAVSDSLKPMSGQLRERFGRDHVIVQVRAFSHSAATPSGPTYRVTQEIGGVVQLFPVGLLKEKRSLPVQLFVGNTKKTAQTVFLTTDVHYPPGWEGTPLSLPTEPRTLQPGAFFIAKGSIGKEGCPCGDLKCLMGRDKQAGIGSTALTGAMVLFGTIGIGGFAYYGRRKRRYR